MMNSPIEEIKSKLDIVEVIGGYINLKKGGKDYKACCPFHSEKTPSFFVSPVKQIWHCFGCGVGGDMFSFVMQMEGLEFVDALRNLAQKAGVVLKKQDPKLKSQLSKLYEVCKEATDFFIKNLQKNGKALAYLKKRGLLEKTIKEFEVGYANDSWDSLYIHLTELGHKAEDVEKAGLIIESKKSKSGYYDRFRGRIIFPISDISGQVVGFTGRITDNTYSKDGEAAAKYVNSPETMIFHKSQILYGFNKAKVEIRKEEKCILVEGQLDVLMSHQGGIKNVVATSGTALTIDHLSIIKRYTENLLFSFDTDLAGEEATKKSINLAQKFEFNIKIIILLEEKDPADVIKKDLNAWKEAVEGAKSIMDFYFANCFSKYNLEKIEDKRKVVQELLPPIKRIANQIEQAHWLQILASKLTIQEKLLLEALAKVKIQGEPSEENIKENKNQITTKKSRLQNLEENLLGFALKYPEYLKHIRKNLDAKYLTTEVIKSIFQKLKKADKEIDLEKIKKEFLKDQAYYIDHILFQIEHYDLSKKDALEEIDFYIKEIKSKNHKEKSVELSLAIKKAEVEGDKDKVKILTEDFNKLSKKIANL